MIKKFLSCSTARSAIALTEDNKYIIVEPYHVFVTELEPEAFEKQIEIEFESEAGIDFSKFESYALDDCDSSYFKDSKYRTDIMDTILKAYIS